MAGDVPRHSVADHQPTHTHGYTYSCSSKINPRSSPPLYGTGTKLTTEPRNLNTTRGNQYNDNYYRSENDNYTHASGSDNLSASYRKRLIEFIGDEDLQRLADLKIEEPRRLDTCGTNDNKDVPRSYAEVVKTSSPTKGSTRSTYQLPPARPKSPKRIFCEAAKLRAQSHVAVELSNKPRHVADKPSTSDSGRMLIGHDNTVGFGDRTTNSTQWAHQSITRGVSLDENNLRTTYQRQSAGQSSNNVAARNSYPVRAYTTGTTSFLDSTKGIGEWAIPESTQGNHSLYTDIPRCVSTTSPHYQALLSLDSVVQCAAGNSKQSGSSRQSTVPKSRGAGVGKGGRGGKRNTGKGLRNGNNGGGNGDGSDDNNNDLEGPQDSLGPASPPLKWYACPFHKHDPSYFSTNDFTRMRYKTCSAKGWTDISRLKEHLYRVHIDRICDTCQVEFGSEEELKVHCPYPELASCPARPRVARVSKGILPDVEKLLRKRPRSGMTNEDRWFAIWTLLFPDEERPSSPYSDLQDVESLQEFMDQQMYNHFTANLSISLDGMGFSPEMKALLVSIAANQEQASRHELLELYQKKDSPSPGPASEEGESPGSAIMLPITIQPTMEATQRRNLFFQQSNIATASPNGYGKRVDHVSSPRTAFLAESSTPAFSHPMPRPTTPAPNSSNSSNGKSSDSAYYSGSNEFPPGLSKDRQHVNPAFLATPTPSGPNPTWDNMFGSNISTTRSYPMSYAGRVAGKQPESSTNTHAKADTPMYDDLTDEDAPGEWV